MIVTLSPPSCLIGRTAALLSLLALAFPAAQPTLAQQQRGSDPKIAFVTSTTGSHIFSTWAETSSNGLVGADEICQARALAGGLANHLDFVAWISDSTDDAFCR